jgi:hypothetical protein
MKIYREGHKLIIDGEMDKGDKFYLVKTPPDLRSLVNSKEVDLANIDEIIVSNFSVEMVDKDDERLKGKD